MNAVATRSDVRSTILDTARGIMGVKGYSAVGLNEILAAAGVPKGSFYHYFGSKDAFGEALLNDYFDAYLTEMDMALAKPGLTMAERLMLYWSNWHESQSGDGCDGKCLAVKLGAEVADLSEPMRLALKAGTTGIVKRLAGAIEAGVAEGSLTVDAPAPVTAHVLYQMWLGASVMAKIVRGDAPFADAMTATRKILHLG